MRDSQSSTPKTNPQDSLKPPKNENEHAQWICGEIETIGELKRGAIAAQFPEEFSVDSDFLNQSSNVWLPARLHPEISPGEFQQWLSKHGSSINKVESNIKRRKSILSYSANTEVFYENPLNNSNSPENIMQRRNTTAIHPENTILALQAGDELRPAPFMVLNGQKPSLKRSKLVNKRRDSSAHGRLRRNIERSDEQTITNHVAGLNKKDSSGAWTVSLADLSLAASSEQTGNNQNRKMSTVEILEQISKEVSDLSIHDLGFDGVDTGIAKETTSSTTINQKNSIPDYSPNNINQNSTTKKSTTKLTNYTSNQKIPGYVSEEPKKSKKISENQEIGKPADTKQSKQQHEDTQSSKKNILPSAISFLRFGKGKSNKDKSQSKDEPQEPAKKPSKNTTKPILTKPHSKKDEKKPETSWDNQSGTHPATLKPVRPQPSNFNTNRLPIHIERAIYRLASIKLTNPRRPLHQQVLLSNMMYWYLELINPRPTISARGPGNSDQSPRQRQDQYQPQKKSSEKQDPQGHKQQQYQSRNQPQSQGQNNQYQNTQNNLKPIKGYLQKKTTQPPDLNTQLNQNYNGPNNQPRLSSNSSPSSPINVQQRAQSPNHYYSSNNISNNERSSPNNTSPSPDLNLYSNTFRDKPPTGKGPPARESGRRSPKQENKNVAYPNIYEHEAKLTDPTSSGKNTKRKGNRKNTAVERTNALGRTHDYGRTSDHNDHIYSNTQIQKYPNTEYINGGNTDVKQQTDFVGSPKPLVSPIMNSVQQSYYYNVSPNINSGDPTSVNNNTYTGVSKVVPSSNSPVSASLQFNYYQQPIAQHSYSSPPSLPSLPSTQTGGAANIPHSSSQHDEDDDAPLSSYQGDRSTLATI
ncbi:hypothetical protein BB559_001466 [Furculomyces boomerangus]|uniref:Protein Zds1 C-terminal domain-containing protein n=2 Tax=Furculomyces boomerangus TaxID=61424 RepID=A0A2T9Z1Y2_9FUNG|nr:hypothetical protein BB559_001466 [Furculomyces boomerangus]